MNTPVLLAFTALTMASTPVFGSTDSACPSGLPSELFIDCVAAVGMATSDENDPGAYFGKEPYNVTEQLQAWVDRQMQRDIARESTEPAGSDVAQQLDKR